MKNEQLWKSKVWQPEAMFTELFKFAAEWQIWKTAEIPKYISIMNNILSYTLPNITSNNGWKITPWIMYVENNFCCSVNVLANIYFIIQPVTQILLIKYDNNDPVHFSSIDQALLITTWIRRGGEGRGCLQSQISLSLLIKSHLGGFVCITHKQGWSWRF